MGALCADVIAIGRSVAFPEGGGQLGDRGTIRQGDRVVAFRDTQKSYGRLIVRPDFPTISVDTEVQLILDAPMPDGWDDRRPVEITIDPERRAALTRSHTAAHLVYIGILEVEPGASGWVKGCFIEPAAGRFDLGIARMSPEQIEAIRRLAGEWQEADHRIDIEELPGEPECRIWVCNGRRIPCGGTHLESTGPVGALKVSRRSKGKNVERVYYSLD